MVSHHSGEEPRPLAHHALRQVLIQILIDADACPVKEETDKVALRYQVPVVVVSNTARSGCRTTR